MPRRCRAILFWVVRLWAALTAVAAPALAQEIPALPEMRYVAVASERMEGPRIAYMERGRADAVPIVALHGIGANSAYYRFQFGDLARTYRVVAWNAPGYMLSDNLRAERPGCADYADALRAFLDALGLARVHLLGNSFGASVAQCFAAAHPDRVLKLAMTGVSRGARGLPPEAQARLVAAHEAMIAEGGLAMAEKRWAALVAPNPPPWLEAVVKDTLKPTLRRGYIQATWFALREDGLDLARSIQTPTLMLTGLHDKVTPADTDAKILLPAFGNARLEILPDVGHLPDLEAPAIVNDLLRTFFGR